MQWEYHVEMFDAEKPVADYETVLNGLGQDGWEAVGLAYCPTGFKGYLCLLKRPKKGKGGKAAIVNIRR